MASFTNVATLSYNGTTVNSNLVTGEIRETLTVTKTALQPTYGADDTVTYIVNITNSGMSALNALTLSDNLGAITGATTTYPLTLVSGAVRYFLNGVLQPTPTVASTSPLQITGISVPAGNSATLIYETRVNNFAPLATGSTIVNTVTVTGAGVTSAVEATETITVRNEAVLTVSKALSPIVIPENGQITYTFTIQNFGNTAAGSAEDAVLADVFSPALTIQSVTLDGQALTSPDGYSYEQSTGQFTTVSGSITVPAATFTQNTAGDYTITPGTAVLTITGTI